MHPTRWVPSEQQRPVVIFHATFELDLDVSLIPTTNRLHRLFLSLNLKA